MISPMVLYLYAEFRCRFDFSDAGFLPFQFSVDFHFSLIDAANIFFAFKQRLFPRLSICHLFHFRCRRLPPAARLIRFAFQLFSPFA